MRSKRALYNIFSSLLFQAVVIICNFILPILIIKNYGSDVNGLLSSITQFLSYISLLDSGFGVVIKSCLYKPLASKNKNEIKNILRASERFFRTLAIIFVIYIIILCIVYPNVVSFKFDKLFTLSLILILGITTFFEYFFGMSYKIFLQADQRTYVTSNIQIIVTILNALMTVILVLNGFSIQVVKIVASLIFIFRPIVQNIYVKRKYNINLNDADENFKIEHKWDGLAQHIAAIVHHNTDVAVLTFFSLLEVSVYSVYSLVIRSLKSIVTALTSGIDASFGDMLAKGENEHLNKSFHTYELFYFTLITIIFSCTFVLITPFISVYTKGITDVNYIRYAFGYIIVIAEFVYSMRIPYSGITLAAGHFKQTMKGAIVEALLNIVLSIILVWQYGLIGVAIGTLAAMVIRTIEFMYHTSKYILNRSFKKCMKFIIVMTTEFILIVVCSLFLNGMSSVTYLGWIIYAIGVFVIATIIVIIINYIVYPYEFSNIKKLLLKSVKKGK